MFLSPSTKSAPSPNVAMTESLSMVQSLNMSLSKGILPTRAPGQMSSNRSVSNGRQRSKSSGAELFRITGSPQHATPGAGKLPSLAEDSIRPGDFIPQDGEEGISSHSVYSTSAYRENLKSHLTDGPLRAVSQSPDGNRLVVGGQEVLSIVNTKNQTSEGGDMEVEFNILQRSFVGGNKAKNKKVWDVRWHPNEMATIASTSDEGLVTLWDLNASNMKKPVWQGHDDTRSCWRLAWCDPHSANLHLCTGSLDGIVRLWDPRKASCVNQFILGGHHDSSQFPGQGASGLKVRYLIYSYIQTVLQIGLV